MFTYLSDWLIISGIFNIAIFDYFNISSLFGYMISKWYQNNINTIHRIILYKSYFQIKLYFFIFSSFHILINQRTHILVETFVPFSGEPSFYWFSFISINKYIGSPFLIFIIYTSAYFFLFSHALTFLCAILTKCSIKFMLLKFYHFFFKKSIMQNTQRVRTKTIRVRTRIYIIHKFSTYFSNVRLFFVILHKVRTFTSTYLFGIIYT